jgi:hypothetical protein
MTAVISFMHLSLLSPVNDNASGTASRTIHLELCSFRASPEAREINGLDDPQPVRRTDMARTPEPVALRECKARANSEVL